MRISFKILNAPVGYILEDNCWAFEIVVHIVVSLFADFGELVDLEQQQRATVAGH
jgi:hypothetical protein